MMAFVTLILPTARHGKIEHPVSRRKVHPCRVRCGHGQGDTRSKDRQFKSWRSFSLGELWKLAGEKPMEGKLWMEIAKRENTPKRKQDALSTGLTHDRTNEYLWHMLGMVLWRAGQTEEAGEAFDNGLALCRKGSRAALYQAKALLLKETNKYSDGVIDLLKDGLVENEEHGPLYVALANHYVDVGKKETARETFMTAAERAPEHPAVWRAWAHFEKNQGNLVESKAKWEVAVTIAPREPRSWLNYADLEIQIGSPESTRRILLEGVKMNPKSTELRVMLSKLEEDSQNVDGARKVLENMLTVESDGSVSGNSVVLRALAALEARSGNYERARELYSTATEAMTETNLGRKDEIVKTFHAWALLEVKLGNSDKARSLLEQAAELSPRSAGVWRAVAELETRSRNFNKARDAFQRGVANHPADARIWLAWGKMELTAGSTARAEELLLKAAQDIPRESELPIRHLREQKRAQGDALRTLAANALREGSFEKCPEWLLQATTKDPTNAQAWRERAEIALKLNGCEAMREVYQSALLAVPKTLHAKLYHWMGSDERRYGDYDHAREAFEKGIEADKTYVSTWTSWALLEKDQGNIQISSEIFERAAAIAETEGLKVPFLFVSWGRVLERDLGQVEKARSVFENGIRDNPDFSALYQSWGQLEERQGDIERARELFKVACEVEPGNGSLWQSRALLEARYGNIEVSRELFEKGIEMDPKSSPLYAAYAVVEARNYGRLSFARELFKKATAADPMYAQTWHAWGAIEAKEGNYEAAEKLYELAGKADSSDPACWHALAMLKRAQGDAEAARKHFQHALSVDPKHALSYQCWAILEAKDAGGLGFEAASRIFEEASASLNPVAGWPVWQSWATIEAERGNMEKALAILEDATKRVPNCAALFQTYGVLQRDCGKYDEARKLFGDGARACPRDSAPVFSAWGKMEQELGNIDVARELYKRGIDVNPSNEACWNLYASLEESEGNFEEAERLRLVASGVVRGSS